MGEDGDRGGGGLGACGGRSSTELTPPQPTGEPADQLPEVKAAPHRSGRIQIPARTAFDAVHG